MTRPSIRRLGRTLKPPPPPKMVRRIFTTVSSVTPGASTDGLWQVAVLDGEDEVVAPYSAAYIAGNRAPQVGDQVAVDFVNGSPMIAHLMVGFPTF